MPALTMPESPVSPTRSGNERMMFLAFFGIVIGLCGGLVAEGLLRAINFITDVTFYGIVSDKYLPPSDYPLHWWVFLLPAAGGLLVGLLVQYCAPEIKGDGIPAAMAVVLTKRSIVPPRVSFFKPLSAAITVGTGGPFGAEGPILQTGGAIGSLISQLLPTSASERRIMLACGAAAGLAGVFKTPFAGVMIAVELLVFEFRARSFIPIALASATGSLVAEFFRGAAPVFPINPDFHFHIAELPFFILLGIGCAALAWLMTRTLYACEEFFEHIKVWFPVIPAVGGLAVGAIALWHPEVLGMGYAVIADLLARYHSLGQLVGIGVAKLGAFAIALGSGASGGTFAPALMIGGSFGAAFGEVVHMVLPSASSPAIYGVVATAALFGSIYRATPTAILFLLEVTGAYHAMLPLFLVSIIADLAVHYFMEHTINTERLVKEGIAVPDAFVADPMKLLRVRDVMTPQVDTVAANAILDDVTATLLSHQAVPVVNDEHRVVAVLHRSDLLNAHKGATAQQLGRAGFIAVYPDDILHEVALKLVEAGDQSCPVLDRGDGSLVGMISSYDLLKAKQWEHEQEQPEVGQLLRFKTPVA